MVKLVCGKERRLVSIDPDLVQLSEVFGCDGFSATIEYLIVQAVTKKAGSYLALNEQLNSYFKKKEQKRMDLEVERQKKLEKKLENRKPKQPVGRPFKNKHPMGVVMKIEREDE